VWSVNEMYRALYLMHTWDRDLLFALLRHQNVALPSERSSHTVHIADIEHSRHSYSQKKVRHQLTGGRATRLRNAGIPHERRPRCGTTFVTQNLHHLAARSHPTSAQLRSGPKSAA
jgi:hypothetical protein